MFSQNSMQLKLKNKCSERNASLLDGVCRACASLALRCVGFETEPGFESDEKCRLLLISLGVRRICTPSSAEGTGMHSRVIHFRNIGFVLKVLCMDEI